MDLFDELADRIDDHSFLSYTPDGWTTLKESDEDPDNANNVLLVYGYDDNNSNNNYHRSRGKDFSGSTGAMDWNREHVYPRSLASPNFTTTNPGPGTDVHNLKPADAGYNSTRSNRKFTAGSGDSGVQTNGGFYPGDEWKGDIARIVMYMYLRYHGNGSSVSEQRCLPNNVTIGSQNGIDSKMINLLLDWNREDPVNAFESNRNDVIAREQGNRNPFVDNPYLATLIWGGANAEDRWNMNSDDDEAPTAPSNLNSTSIEAQSIAISWTASTDNEGVFEYMIYVDDVYIGSSQTTSFLIENLCALTSYNVKVVARDAAGNESDAATERFQTTSQTALSLPFSENFESCESVKFVAVNEASSKDWVCETQYGKDGSGSYSVNGYQQAVLSKDWLITKKPIDFDNTTEEKLSLWTSQKYGNSTLDLVYSLDYDGCGAPQDATWSPVPNATIPNNANNNDETVFEITNADVSMLNGQVYFAFKYYSNNSPTRYKIDNFEISGVSGPPDTEMPSQVINMSVSNITHESAEINWDAATDNRGVTAYEVYVDGNLYNTVTNTQIVLTGLDEEQSYQVTVRALDAAANEGPLSDALSFTTIKYVDTVSPSEVTGVAVDNITFESADLSWVAATDNIGVVSYEVYLNNSLVTTTAETTFVLSNLSADTDYEIYIMAVDAAGNKSTTANILTFKTLEAPDTEAPSKVVNVDVSNITHNSATVNWDTATDNKGVTGYLIYLDNNLYETVNTTSVELTSLNELQSYDVQIKAVDAAGNDGDLSDVVTFSTIEYVDDVAPSDVQGLSVTNITHESASLNWNDATDNIGVVSYEIYLNNNLLSNTSGTSYSLTSLNELTSYTVSILAVDAVGNKSSSATEVSFTTLETPDTEAPSTPQNITVSDIADFTAKVSWSAATDNKGVTAYEIFLDDIKIAQTAQLEFSLENLNPETTYTVSVTAMDAALNISPKSDVKSFTTLEVQKDITDFDIYPVPVKADNRFNSIYQKQLVKLNCSMLKGP